LLACYCLFSNKLRLRSLCSRIYSRKPMSKFLENQKVKDGDSSEITPTDPTLVSGDSKPETKPATAKETSPAPSDSSTDSCEEKPSSPTLLKKRSNFKVRSRSDSFCNERTGSRGSLYKGILKASISANRLRSLSESCAENYRSISQKDESNSGLDEWSKEEKFEEEDESDSCQMKKTVRFSETIHRQLFRSNSSILGQRKKNQRKQRKKKRNDSHTLSSSAESENAVYIAQISNATEQLSLCDSGIEDSDPAEGSPPTAQTTVKSKKQSGKSKKGKKNSEPSTELMFDIDL